MEDIKSIVRIHSDIGSGCKHCDAVIDGSGEFDGSVNHYLQQHGYRLLHVGSEAGTDHDGRPCHFTVAIVGSDDPPPEREPVTVEVHTNLNLQDP